MENENRTFAESSPDTSFHLHSIICVFFYLFQTIESLCDNAASRDLVFKDVVQNRRNCHVEWLYV